MMVGRATCIATRTHVARWAVRPARTARIAWRARETRSRAAKRRCPTQTHPPPSPASRSAHGHSCSGSRLFETATRTRFSLPASSPPDASVSSNIISNSVPCCRTCSGPPVAHVLTHHQHQRCLSSPPHNGCTAGVAGQRWPTSEPAGRDRAHAHAHASTRLPLPSEHGLHERITEEDAQRRHAFLELVHGRHARVG